MYWIHTLNWSSRRHFASHGVMERREVSSKFGQEVRDDFVMKPNIKRPSPG